ncbi:MAG: hypothetical protein U0271_00180 [Polyangiaceae bacterium]
MNRATLPLWVLSGLLVLGVIVVMIVGRGCFGTTASALKEHGARVEARVSAVRAVAEDMRTQPFVTDGAMDFDGAGVAVTFGRTRADATGLVIHEEDLAHLDELGAVFARVPQTKVVAECTAILEHRTHPWDPLEPTRWTSTLDGSFSKAVFERCEAAKYLLVVRTLELVRPSVLGKECAHTPCKFSSGHVRGEVHLYSLDPVKHHGAALFEAESSENASISLGTEVDLAHASARSIAASVTALAPKATFDTSSMNDE